ncbi:acetylornithine transaminase [Corynebacterium sp. P5848]|uniref:acetylornithine transaminase n=1 Tax=Corynebacterium marambiense TaxID=2765364 RepID=UPI0022608C29|nr:acetylornithine transaminase [Corynebacterium marambiense]MCX7541863.1 acetylornithine transaminase [Corynebacterium marambiense]
MNESRTDNFDALGRWSEALMNTYAPALDLISGNGAEVTAADGTVYLDLLAGIAVNSLGHAHPAVIEAVETQIRRFAHVSNLFASRPVVEVAEKLKQRFAHGDSDVADSTRVFFCNSGAEANEAAFKLARLTGRHRVLAAKHGFHGRTMGSLGLTGQPDKRAAFEPLPGGVEFFPYGDIDYLRKMVEINAADTAAIILEPIQGETGVIPAPDGYLAAVRALCDEHGILFIADEVQTGVGRTGDFFAHAHEGILPDVVTMAKGLGAGLPIGACLAHGTAATLFGVGSHGTTFGGNPVSCAAASVVLDTIDEDFVAEVRAKGEHFTAAMKSVDGVTEVRGRGLMLGLVLDRPVAKEAVTVGLKHGVILNAPSDTVIRITPPLVITTEQLDVAAERIAAVLTDVWDSEKNTEG